MAPTDKLLLQLNNIRNKYGAIFSEQKISLLENLREQKISSKNLIDSYYKNLLFLLAHPDNKNVYALAKTSLHKLEEYINSHSIIQQRLFNSGITGTELCASYSLEMVKWFREKHSSSIFIADIEADDAKIQSVLSVILTKVESEIFHDGNTNWKLWMGTSRNKEDLLDKLISSFSQSNLRPEVKDELWDSLGINVQIAFPVHSQLPESLVSVYCHKSITRSPARSNKEVPKETPLSYQEAEQIIDCSRMILLRHLREIDPITFSSPELVSYYKLSRGISVALFGMTPQRRHPVDSYMGYVVFKNGLPVAYAGSWILFDSARIGLNVFPAYRGGESQYLFQQVMNLHEQVYHLNRFTVDPYQIGKDNNDGIKSGAFWLYYRLGFQPIKDEQKKVAEEEFRNIKKVKGYRSPFKILEMLADSRMELVMNNTAVKFDATDISRVYADIVKKNFNNNRKAAEEYSFRELRKILQLKNMDEENLSYVFKNWSVILMANEKSLRGNKKLISALKELFLIKANGKEELFITKLQHSTELKKFVKIVVSQHIEHSAGN